MMSLKKRFGCILGISWKGLLPPFLLLLTLLIFAVSIGAHNRPVGNIFHVTILHTNDLHSHAKSFMERGRLVGGIARIGHLIRLIRDKNQNTVVVDAGDIFQGTPMFRLYHGEVEVNLLNKIGYDIFTIGNHEFDDGTENLSKQLRAAKFQILSSNLDCSKEPELQSEILPSAIKNIGDSQVGFVGAITPDLNQLAPKLGNVRLKATGPDWMEPIATEVAQVKARGVNKIILVTHCGLERDRELAQSLPDVDVIIGGHSHTRLDAPAVVTHGDGSTTLIVQTGAYGRALGKLDLAFDSSGKLITEQVGYHLINITDRIFEDRDLKAYIDEKSRPFDSLTTEIAGTASGEFENRFKDFPWDSAIGDLIADALWESGRSYGSQIAFENRGGIRGRIERGPITMEKVEEILPFDNHLTFATVSGACILKAMEHSFAGPLGGSFLDEHGLKIAYDPTRPPGNRIVFALAQDKDGNWQTVNQESKYKIVVNDYTFQAGEGYDFSSAENIEHLPDRLSVSLASYLRSHGTATPTPPTRIVPVTRGLLEVDSQSASQFLHLKGSPPGAHLTLVSGTDRGVDSVLGKIPVPLANPRIIGRSISNQTGEYFWPLPVSYPSGLAPHSHHLRGTEKQRLNLVDKNEQTPCSNQKGKISVGTWFAVIVEPRRRAVTQKIMVSYPIAVNQ